MEFEDRILSLKRHLDVKTNKDLAEALGINYQTLSTWIRRREIPAKGLITINKILAGNDVETSLFNAKDPISGESLLRITALIPSVSYAQNLKNLEETVVSMIISEALYDIFTLMDLERNPEVQPHPDETPQDVYLEVNGPIYGMIMDCVFSQRTLAEKADLSETVFGELFTKSEFRKELRGMMSWMMNYDKADDIVADRCYKIRNRMEKLPLAVIRYWLNADEKLKNKIFQSATSFLSVMTALPVRTIESAFKPIKHSAVDFFASLEIE